MVDPIDQDALDRYIQKMEFIELLDADGRLFLPIKTVISMFVEELLLNKTFSDLMVSSLPDSQ
ncbi:hypothetical protein ZMTM_16220 [Methyloradius palustris]|uniref:Uncharacterized protein n=1 Tax=Methyloradius palustris TaxID=2778876 RepID=A0A8D5K140_9PROT|nr:hypothetical protein ZMTM_16220 [Methyloradius palustris]